MKDTEDRRIVSEYLQQCGLEAREIPAEKLESEKAPDFEVFKDGKFVFFCEVKRIDKGRLMGFLDGRDRLSKKIHKAKKQFDSLNSALEHPNVLAFVNYNEFLDAGDLDYLVQGLQIRQNNGSIFKLLPWGAGRRRIQDEMDDIHLYIWLDCHSQNSKPLRFFLLKPDKHLEFLCHLFGQDPAKIRHGWESRFD